MFQIKDTRTLKPKRSRFNVHILNLYRVYKLSLIVEELSTEVHVRGTCTSPESSSSTTSQSLYNLKFSSETVYTGAAETFSPLINQSSQV